MMQTIEGIYRNGKIELSEDPLDVEENTRVLITFLRPRLVDLAAVGIDETQAAELRARLHAFASDWDQPDMDVYDDYERARTTI